MQVHRVNCQPVESIGRQRNYVALSQAGDNIVNPVWLGFIGMDAQDLRGQEALPQFPDYCNHKDGN